MTKSDGYGAFLAMLLSNREAFFEEVVDGVALGTKLRYASFTVIALAGFLDRKSVV